MERLERNRGPWMRHCEDLAWLMRPSRVGFVSDVTAGERRSDDIYDGTPMRAARALANAMSAMLRPEGEQWIHIRAEDADETDETRAWLDAAEEKLIRAIYNPHARFRQAMGEADLDLTVFGQAVVYTGRSRSLNRLHFRSLHLKDSVVGWDDEGNPDTLFRRHRYTLRQAIKRFTLPALSPGLREQARKEAALDEEHCFVHAVVPNPSGREGAALARNLPISGEWFEEEAKHTVERSGFHEFPFAVPRWDTASGEDTGRSPGMIALPDAATLQAMGETILIAGQRAAAPPLMAPNDGSFDAINTFPDAISYYDVETATEMRGNPIFPLESGHNLPITRDMQQDIREQVREAFFRNVFNLPVPGTDMTATEVLERKEEFIREIGPVFGRLESDYIAPIVERAFMIMLRSGSFGAVPEELAGANIRFEFESPVKRIRQQAEATSAKIWAQETAAMAPVRPDITDNIDFDGLARFTADALNLPERVQTPVRQMRADRQMRAEAEREAAQREAVAQEAAIAKEAAAAGESVARAMA